MLNAVSVHLDEHEAGRVNALRKPALQPIHPMLLEPSSVANDCRAASMERKMPGFPRRLGGSVNDKVTRGSRRMSATLLVSSWEKNHESPSYSTSPLLLIGRWEIAPVSALVANMQKSIFLSFLAISESVIVAMPALVLN
jgi:hypothetical protein